MADLIFGFLTNKFQPFQPNLIQRLEATQLQTMARPSATSTHSLITAWLIAYNVASFAGWAYVLYQISISMVYSGGNYEASYASVGHLLSIVQLCALLEVVHAFVGAVKSPVGTTAMQVASRLFLIALCYLLPNTGIREHVAFTTMVLAWSITEVVRYSYYAASLMNVHVPLLTWARYTFFYLLYPLGAGSELWLVVVSITSAYQESLWAYYFLVFATVVLYMSGLYIMYTYMIRQRSKYLNGDVAGSSSKKAIRRKKDM
ncbi:hypothetical protein BASA50_001612 [Batrachochytrium salamandrivorans]|uniref:Very-long-chain (3R)-3-hydroxyacyl-CoA dehydratase n=1 Tax=Batrachochytrium salamandrivorans TaxID=1357716 RepID=A0ABQ8FNN0_9FUNG|nr:hypothetical protein BASA60_010072 [Batrachochytrium salamandrivorans]KAH6575123.1 hypothetical protein BASA62_002101 [Batrachochytrium salamandrivorans]KAH6587375.1 hypothetical protein BASA61_006323 [Batrachochytrium salamandrivorans]KAH6601422.1 hypothetical protein BASA50_001612 [Batrachochytrium salamandrivorans]KAH9247432.1 hypothetical protein BASA81_014968 [Batrachochytrium salamandrivorans]